MFIFKDYHSIMTNFIIFSYTIGVSDLFKHMYTLDV